MRHFSRSLILAVVGIVSVIDRIVRDHLTSGEPSGSFFVSSQPHIQTRLFGWIDVGGMPWIVLFVLVILTLAFFTALQQRMMRWHDPRAIAIIAMIISAINNLIDRFRFAGVWDYWMVSTQWGGLSFNLADVMITMSIVYLFFRLCHPDCGPRRSKE